MFEQLVTIDTYKDRYEALAALEPQPVDTLKPSNMSSELARIAAGGVERPHFRYDALDEIDFDQKLSDIEAAGTALLDSPDLPPKFQGAYEAMIKRYIDITEMLKLARDYRSADDADKEAIAARYMQINIEHYQEPDERTYRSMLGEKLWRIAQKDLTGQATVIREELLSMVDYNPNAETITRFKPSPETVEWAGRVVEALYGNMLSHVPDKENFDSYELRDIFAEILRDELGEAADDWEVLVDDTSSVVVHAYNKRVLIPESKNFTKKRARELVVHEIGAHVLTSITGEQTDLYGLHLGLSGFGDVQEGIGKVNEQALNGKYVEAGINHYIATGLSYFDHKTPCEIFEAYWRMSLLENIEPGTQSTAEQEAEARLGAARQRFRTFRGTDELPWFKDSSYYHGGTQQVWQLYEGIRGDDFRLTLLLMGKTNTSDDHLRTVLETASR